MRVTAAWSNGFERHITPKHDNWLDMAETELRRLSTQCLDRHILNKPRPIEAVAARQDDRARNPTTANWQFTTADARVSLSGYTWHQ